MSLSDASVWPKRRSFTLAELNSPHATKHERKARSYEATMSTSLHYIAVKQLFYAAVKRITVWHTWPKGRELIFPCVDVNNCLLVLWCVTQIQALQKASISQEPPLSLSLSLSLRPSFNLPLSLSPSPSLSLSLPLSLSLSLLLIPSILSLCLFLSLISSLCLSLSLSLCFSTFQS